MTALQFMKRAVMKSSFAWIYILFFPFIISGLENETEERVDLKVSEIFIGEEFFACINGCWTPIDAVHKDAAGYYTLIRKDPNHNRWRCPSCRFNNNSWDQTCQRELGNGNKCNYPRPW